MRDNRDKKAAKLAKDVLLLSRNTLLVHLRFLDMALSILDLEATMAYNLATDGKKLVFNPFYILNAYKAEKETPAREYLHVVLHCVFKHPFVSTLVNENYWDLACDIAVENTINDLGLSATTNEKAKAQVAAISKLQSEINLLTAEKLYRYFIDHPMSDNELIETGCLFSADDHSPWYQPPQTRVNNSSLREDNDSDNRQETASNGNTPEADSSAFSHAGQGLGEPSPDVAREWEQVSHRTQVDMGTFSKNRGIRAGALMQNLNEVNREKYNYSSFLKRFAVLGEIMKINEDEFDYIFYTYGLKLYGNMPLIEPLEYKEVKRIKEFVLAIDTSGSVAGELVQAFVQKTYNILKSTESFFTKINLHIIQCDAAIQEHVKISTQDEFDIYIKNMKIRGLGGTDFRPVFRFVNQLMDQHEFTRLKGLIYFTDGDGIFPEQMPSYQSAFVFIDDEYNNPVVPPWAIRLVLQRNEI